MQQAAGAFVRFDSNLQGYFSRIGKLNGVAHEVHDNLAQPVRITAGHLRHLGGHLAQEFQPFLVAPKSERFQRGFQMVAHIEIHHFQVNLSRFDFGEIQNVVDHCQQ